MPLPINYLQVMAKAPPPPNEEQELIARRDALLRARQPSLLQRQIALRDKLLADRNKVTLAPIDENLIEMGPPGPDKLVNQISDDELDTYIEALQERKKLSAEKMLADTGKATKTTTGPRGR